RAGELVVATLDGHLVGLVAALHAERAARPLLAGQAVADRDPDRIPVHRDAELAAMTRCLMGAHGGIVSNHSAMGHGPSVQFEITVRVDPVPGSCSLQNETPAS